MIIKHTKVDDPIKFLLAKQHLYKFREYIAEINDTLVIPDLYGDEIVGIRYRKNRYCYFRSLNIGQKNFLKENTIVYGSLYCKNQLITRIKLPNNLTIKGNLLLYNSHINILPNNLTVKGDLNISYTSIKEIPSSLSLSGHLLASGAKIRSFEDKIVKIKYCNLSGCHKLYLEDNMTFTGFLDISHTNIKKLPKNLTVCKSLIINKGSKIKSLPNCLNVLEGIHLIGNNDLVEIPRHLKDKCVY